MPEKMTHGAWVEYAVRALLKWRTDKTMDGNDYESMLRAYIVVSFDRGMSAAIVAGLRGLKDQVGKFELPRVAAFPLLDGSIQDIVEELLQPMRTGLYTTPSDGEFLVVTTAGQYRLAIISEGTLSFSNGGDQTAEVERFLPLPKFEVEPEPAGVESSR